VPAGQKDEAPRKTVAPQLVSGRRGQSLQAAYKPNSVEDGHSSRRRITAALQQPTRRFQRPPFQVATRLGAPDRHASVAVGQAADSLPIWSCSVWGLPCPRLYSRSGALLPHLFTLTRRFRGRAVFFLWHWPSSSLEAGIPDVIRHTALRSSDFPLPKRLRAPAATAQLACSAYLTLRAQRYRSTKVKREPWSAQLLSLFRKQPLSLQITARGFLCSLNWSLYRFFQHCRGHTADAHGICGDARGFRCRRWLGRCCGLGYILGLSYNRGRNCTGNRTDHCEGS
jgi:hypothetical protein